MVTATVHDILSVFCCILDTYPYHCEFITYHLRTFRHVVCSCYEQGEPSDNLHLHRLMSNLNVEGSADEIRLATACTAV